MTSRLFAITTSLLLSLCTLSLAAAEQSVRPGINRNYVDPDWQQWVGILESPQREVYRLRRDIVDACSIKQGMAVADIGAGTGFFTHLFAERVGPAGKVYAIDIARNFIDNILRDSRAHGHRNVDGIVNAAAETGLPPASIELAFISDTYHHFEYPASMLASIHASLRPGGRMIIIDFVREAGVSTDWVMGHVRADKRTVIDEITRAGFELIGDEPLLRYNYFLEFRKR